MKKIVFDTVDSTNAVCRRGLRQGDIQERLIVQATGRRLEPLKQAEPLLACIIERRMQCEEDKMTVMRSF